MAITCSLTLALKGAKIFSCSAVSDMVLVKCRGTFLLDTLFLEPHLRRCSSFLLLKTWLFWQKCLTLTWRKSADERGSKRTGTVQKQATQTRGIRKNIRTTTWSLPNNPALVYSCKFRKNSEQNVKVNRKLHEACVSWTKKGVFKVKQKSANIIMTSEPFKTIFEPFYHI